MSKYSVTFEVDEEITPKEFREFLRSLIFEDDPDAGSMLAQHIDDIGRVTCLNEVPPPEE